MKHIFKEEMHRAIHSFSFLGSVALGTIIAFAHYITHIAIPFANPAVVAQTIADGYLPSVFNQWMGISFTTVESYFFFLILPVLAALPFAGSFSEELKTGFLRVLLLSGRNKRSYYIIKALVVFLTGGIAVIIPLIANLLCTVATIPSFVPIASTAHFPLFPSSMWAELFYSHPWLYTFAYLVIIFVFSGLFAQISLVFSFYLHNRIAVLLSPLLAYIFSYTVCSAFSVSQFAPFCFLPLDQPVFQISFSIILSEAFVIGAFVCFGFILKGSKKDVY